MANFYFLQLWFLSIFSCGYFYQVKKNSDLVTDYSVIFLNGTSLELPNRLFLSYFSPIGFSFRTCRENGILLSQVNDANDSMLIQLKNGTLLVSFDFPAQNRTVIYNPNRKFSDNNWVNLYFHKAFITAFSKGQAIPIANISSEVFLKFYDEQKSTKLFFGSENKDVGFVGCIASGPNLNLSQSLDNSTSLDNCPLNGKTCEPDSCDAVSCLNDGLCLSFNSTYSCQCPANHTGVDCEVFVDLSCTKNASQCANGTCVDAFRPGSSWCQCSLNSYGSSCSYTGRNPCGNLPCLNGAACISDNSGNFSCICQPGFVGKLCEIEVYPCLSAPCLNGGRCVSAIDNFECICNGSGYSGRFCEADIDECQEKSCLAAHASCINRPGDYICLCPPGLEGEECEIEISLCSLNPCRNGGTCLHVPSSNIMCVCDLGFTGLRCEQEIDFCEENDCNPSSQMCVSEGGRYYCHCRDGFGGADCEEINECESAPCLNNATCLDLIGSFYCNCSVGYQGILCQTDINECEGGPCKNGARCFDEVGDYRCMCQIGWTGKNCTQEFNPCRSNPCENNATCSNLPDVLHPPYSCYCQPGFSGDRCENNIDDCVLVTCPYNEVCVDLINAYACVCDPGFARDERKNCTVDVNECASSPCQNGGNCSDLLNGFECVCEFGYEGEVCDREVDFCASEPCLNGGLCEAAFGTYACYCKPGFVGTRCEAGFDSCFSDPCRNGNCTSVAGTYRCDCDVGFQGTSCELDVNECESNPCRNNGNCSDLIGRYDCTCVEGWSGDVCDVNINECLSMPCKNGANCTDQVSGYVCHCTVGYTGDHCEVDINECDSSPCLHGGWCIDGVASFRCVCDDTGYEGLFCEVEIDECERGSMCRHGSRCIDRVNDYTCQCLSGYTGKFCEVDIKECDSHPCLNNGSCMELSDESLYPTLIPLNFSYKFASGFVCNCTDGFEGSLCETETDECVLWDPCKNNGTCIDQINNYRCECPSEVGGRNCSVPLLGCAYGHNCSENSVCKPYLKDEDKGLHAYTCECLPGHSGPFCDRPTSGTFRGSQSRAAFFFRSSESPAILSFAFRTTLSEVTLAALYLNSMPTSISILIFLRHGRLHCSMNDTTLSTHDHQNNGDWHSVFVRLNSAIEFTPFDVFGSNLNSTIDVSSNSTYLRVELGRLDTPPNLPFTGCMRDVALNGMIRPFSDADYVEGVQEGCVKPEVCFPSSCSGRGACKDLWFESSCQCSQPYIGENCSFESIPSTFGYKDLRSYAAFQLPFSRVAQLNVSMFILTSQPDGFLLQAGSSNSSLLHNTTFARFYLSNGFLRVNLEDQVFGFDEVALDDGDKHFLSISITDTAISAQINDERYEREISLNASFFSTDLIFVGGLPETKYFKDNEKSRRKRTAPGPTNFKGALQDIHVGNIVLMLFPDNRINDSLIRSRVFPIDISNIERGLVSDPLCGEPDSNWAVNPCENNGTCQTTFNRYTCECTDAWQGRNCQDPVYCEHINCPGNFSCSNLPHGGAECVGPTSIGLSNKVLVFHYNSSLANSTDHEISFEIRTRSANASILHVESGNTFIRVSLDYFGHVELVTSNTSYTFMQKPINDGEWHKIVLVEQKKLLFVTVDDRIEIASNISFASVLESVLSDSDNRLHIGNLRNVSFTGCLDNFRVKGLLLPFYKWSMVASSLPPPDMAFQIVSGDPVVGCHGDDVCNHSENPCHNNGSCIDQFNEFQCDCRPGFSGATCEHDIDDCVNVNCSGRGFCRDLENGFTCECEFGFGGILCEIDLDECSSSPCLHHGNCRNLIGSFECDCSGTNFTGKRCEIDATKACGSKDEPDAPCENGGTCNNMTSSDRIFFNCTCPPHFHGDKCQNIFDPCENVTCLNGGYCIIDPFTVTAECHCRTGFSGERCEEKFDPCSNSSCMNNATCISLASGYRCHCVGGFVGEHCEHRNLCIGSAFSDSYCDNNATCQVRFDPEPSFSCLCNSTYTGERCTFINPCSNVTCLNGGKCRVTWPGSESSSTNSALGIGDPEFQCDCEPGFSGEKCEEKIDIHHSMVVLGSSIGGVVLFLLLISCLSYFFAVAVDRRATSGAYSPSKQEAMNSGPPVPSGFVGMEVWTELKPPPRCERLI